MERDPVCGMMVEPERAKATAVHAGRTYYFCCTGCASKFNADPQKYLAGKPAAALLIQLGAKPASAAPLIQLGGGQTAPSPAPTAAKAGAYVCPMDPEVRQDRPGACPKCGMALEPEMPAAPATRVEYTCPMHPEIVRPGPGSCPICGMALEPRTVTVEDEENPELVSMTRRFWISAALALPVLALGMSDMIPGQPVRAHALDARDRMDRVRAGDAGCRLVRLAVLRARLGVARESQPEYVHADRARHWDGLRVQRDRRALRRRYFLHRFEAAAAKCPCISRLRR